MFGWMYKRNFATYFTPYDLFSTSEPGAWYDPSDLSTLFQDSAGTTPVTAVEQPVGRMLDLSGNGNHATQATTTKRPVVSRRVNLLTKTEQFDDSIWLKSNGTLSAANSRQSPDGTLSADYFSASEGTAQHTLQYQLIPGVISSGVTYTGSICVHPDTVSHCYLRFSAGPAFPTICLVSFDLNTATINAATNATGTIETLDGGWYRVSITATAIASGATYFQPTILDSAFGNGVGVGNGLWFWGASVTLAIDAHLPYQSVNTATDYDADPSKFPTYLRFDGVDDAIVTGNIDFTGTDNVTVWAGVEKLSDAAVALIASSGIGSGAFELFGPRSAGGGQKYAFSTRNGSVIEAISVTERSAPDAAVLTGISNTSGGVATLRRNGVDLAVSTASPSGVNHGNYPLSIGSRAGTAYFLNGRLYSLIVRGAQTPLSQIEAAELYIKQKMRMP